MTVSNKEDIEFEKECTQAIDALKQRRKERERGWLVNMGLLVYWTFRFATDIKDK